jgi:hypothetical protein
LKAMHDYSAAWTRTKRILFMQEINSILMKMNKD